MKLYYFSLFSLFSLVTLSTSLFAQQQPTNPSIPDPVSVELQLTVAGEKYSIEFSPEMITSWNKFLQAQNLPGEFGERFLLSIQLTSKNIMLRPEYAPASISAQLEAEKIAQQQKELAANTAAMGRNAKGINKPNRVKPDEAKPTEPAELVKPNK